MLWYNLGSSDTSIAGATSLLVNCSTHTMTAGSFYYNFPHFNATSHTYNQYRCTAIHENGHGMGFDHNTLTSILLIPHSTRCHDQLIYTLQTHDKNDINNRY